MAGKQRTIVVDGTFAHWRVHARALLAEGAPPAAVRWIDPTRTEGDAGLFAEASEPTPAPPAHAASPPAARIPRGFAERLASVGCHSDPEVWALLYRVLARLQGGQGAPRLVLTDALDPDLARFEDLEKSVRRDAHKMHAFVRFRRVPSANDSGGERYIAWHRPRHRIVEREAGFFRRRFPSMAWSILSPSASAHWDTRELVIGPGAPRSAAPDEDEMEALWLRYYGSIFNPARVKLEAMRAEMPKHYWETMPETRIIPELLDDVPRRLSAMAEGSRARADSAAPFVPREAGLAALGRALHDCEGCELFRNGTRAVFGEGPQDARLVLLGEQPGDEEERAGRPFVGPAGKILDRALEAAGIVRETVYVTNAVKHFHHRVEPTPRGKRRLHARPRVGMVSRCQPWIDAELDRIRPEVLVCLGATAARAVFGPTFRLSAERGAACRSRYAPVTLATYHPSAILRADTAEHREDLRATLEQDLRAAARALRHHHGGNPLVDGSDPQRGAKKRE